MDMGEYDVRIRLHYPGVYRVSIGHEPKYFGQVKHVGREWHAEVRHTKSGNVARYAGIWSRRKDAIREVLAFLKWN